MMKTTLVATMILLTLSLFIFLPHTEAADYTQLGLPEGAKARLGKGIIGDITYSPDGTLLAVASSVGIWLYDAETYQEHALLTGHTFSAYSVSFSPDGTTLASVSYGDNMVRLWDVATATLKHTLTGHTSGVVSVSFSPDGAALASASYDRTVRLWDVATATLKHTLTGHTDSVNGVLFSPDGTTLASRSYDRTVRLWDVATATLKGTLEHTNRVWYVEFSPDGTTLASNGYPDTTVRLWDVATATLKHTLTGHTDGVIKVSFSPDGTTLASGSSDQTVRLWDVATATLKHTLTGHTFSIGSLSFSPDGTTLASGSSDQTVRLWDVATATHKATLEYTKQVRNVMFSPDGSTLASIAYHDTTVRLWDVATATLKHTLTGYTDRSIVDWLSNVSFSPDGKTIASGGGGGKVYLWDVATATLKHTLRVGETVNSISFSPDGTTLASVGDDYSVDDYSVHLWDVATGTYKYPLTGHTDDVFRVSFSPDGTTLASASGHEVRLWDVATATQKGTPIVHTDWVSSVAFSPDGTTLASASENGTVHLWDVATATPKSIFRHTYPVISVSFSPDGTTLASASGLEVRLWDVATATQKGTPIVHTDWVSIVVFSPDGTTLASGSDDSTVRLWDVATATQKATLTGHSHEYGIDISFSPDGTTLASGSGDGTVLLWDLSLYLDIAPETPDTVTVPTDEPDSLTTLQSDTFDGQELQSFWEVQNGDQSSFELRDGNLVVQGSFNQNIWRDDTTTGFYQVTDEQKFSVETSLIFDHSDLCSEAGLIIKSPSQNEWVSLKLWGHGVDHGWIMNPNSVYLQLIHRGREVVRIVPDYNPPAGNVPVALRIDRDGDNYRTWYKPDAQGEWVHVADTTVSLQAPVQVGIYTAICQAEAPGHLTVSFDNFIVSTDDIPGPAVTILTPSEGSILDHGRPVITGNYSGAAAPVSLSLTLNGVEVQADDISDSEFTYTPHETLVDGEYTLVAEVTDANGKSAEATVTFTVIVPTDEPDSLTTLQSDTFDGSGQNLQSFWEVQNGEKSSWELKDGQLIVNAGFNQNLWADDTSTRFYQITDEEQFTVETSFVFDHDNYCSVTGLVILSPTTEDRYGRQGEWVTLKAWGQGTSTRLQFQHREFNGVTSNISLDDNPPKGDIPIAMRMQRNGDNYTAWYKSEAEGEWVHIGDTTISLQGPVEVGIFTGICQPETEGHLTVSFDNFIVSSDDIPGPTVAILMPSEGQTYDHGRPVITGSYSGAAAPVLLSLTLSGVEVQADDMSDGEFTYTPHETLVDGEYTLVAEVTDANGKTAEATVTFSVIVPTDDPTQIVVDWVDLERHDLSLLPSIRSTDSTMQTAITIVNESEYEITYYWIGLVGDETFYGSVAAGATYSQSTYVGHVWLIKDHRGRNLAIFEAKEVNGRVTIGDMPEPMLIAEDINKDGVVNIQDLMLVAADLTKIGEYVTDVNEDGEVNIADLVLVAGALGSSSAASASTLKRVAENLLLREDVEQWLAQAMQLNLKDPQSLRGIRFLERLLLVLTPQKTALFPNYPNPFNPETWIPYQLAKDAEVHISIFSADGKLIRTLDLGDQGAGSYLHQSRAAYWDGKNQIGEPVASGIYFYTLKAGDFSATRKMLIRK